MYKCINISEILGYLFDEDRWIGKAAQIIAGILAAGCSRISQIAEQMSGLPAANYKMIQRFVAQVDVKGLLLRLFQEEAEFVIGDPTEMPRPQAKKTAYVGRLSDGQTLGYWLMLLATPFRGRAIPFHFITYSSRTIGAQANSRNHEHFRAFAEIKSLLGERPLVLDREFSYLELLQSLVMEQVHFVIRLKVGLPQIGLFDLHGQSIRLTPKYGQTVIYHQVGYKGLVPVNLIGLWREGFQTPLWVMTDLEPEKGLQIYLKRMKIEESFRDCKTLLGLDRLMNKNQAHLEQMIALTLLAYVVGLFLGETLRDVCYGNVLPQDVSYQSLLTYPTNAGSKWNQFSGLFVLLKQRLRLSPDLMAFLQQPIAHAFSCLIFGHVRSFV